ncbi:MAG TPA: ATP-binding protein [Gemmatimonadales bacterium]|nr:ATP-binding protein [Gemmatimonadales bacterium]
MKLATRLFATTSLLVAAVVAALIVSADRLLRRQLEDEIARGLQREARLVMRLLPADSLAWPDAARALGTLIGRRVTLIDRNGRVRGDTEFDRGALPRLENHATRPEVRAARDSGVGRAERVSASTNERQLYVAVRGGPGELAAVRVSTTLAAVDARLHTVQGAVALAGLTALLAAAGLAWLLSRDVAKPLVQLADAARAIAQGRSPAFPDSTVPEVSRHISALHTMHQELDRRFAELRREREETATLIETMADGVLAADARGDIVTLNTAARRLLGYGAAEPLPPLAELFHDKSARDLVDAILAGRDAEPVDLALAGEARLLAGRALPNGGALLVVRDVTKLRRLETVRRDFVANVSHELKTPLTSIVGYAETLAAEAGAGPPSQTEQFAQTILNNARRMQRLVDDLLDLSRIESRHWQAELEPVDIAAAVREAWASIAERAREQRVELAVQTARGADTLTADPDAVRQILTNLFDNALRHTLAGGRITVSADPANDGVVLAVRDTGSGIAPEHLPRIFERFYRADPGRSRAQGGTGLGLAIVKHLVEAHGGRAEARSTPGKGTTIRMYFPAGQAVE